MADGPANAPAAPSASSTANAPASAPASGGPPISPGALTGNGTPAPASAAKPGPGGALTPQEVRYLHKHRTDDGAEIDVDITGWKHRVKVDGEEREVGLKDLLDGYGPRVVSLKRFETAAAKMREVTERENRLRANLEKLSKPETLLDYLVDQHGDRAYDLLASRLAERVKYEKLPPQERERFDRLTAREKELRRREAEAEQRQAQIEAAQKAEQRKRGEATLAQWRAEWPSKFEAMGLPNHPAVMKQATDYALDLLVRARRSNAPMTIGDALQDAADHVRGLLEAAGQVSVKRVEERIAKQPGREVPEEQPRAIRRQPVAMQRRSFTDVLADMANKG